MGEVKPARKVLTREELASKACKQIHFITSRHPKAKSWTLALNRSGKVYAEAKYDE